MNNTVLEDIGSITVPVALTNINMNNKEKKPYDPTLMHIWPIELIAFESVLE